MILKETRMVRDRMVVFIKPRCRRSHTPEQADPRGIAHGSLAMSIAKEHASVSESIDVRSKGLGMAAKTSNPVI